MGHAFGDPHLLVLALTHRSWCAENAGEESNERLEFLGDAVLGLVVADDLFRANPTLPEGSLAKSRAGVVSAPVLAEVGAELELGPVLRLGKGEDATGGRSKRSILADAVEAVIGAVYLDGGLDAARAVILAQLGARIAAEVADGPGGTDHKTKLQELAAQRHDELPAYELTDDGPDHDKRFYAEVRLEGRVVGRGQGRSKKLAEQAAAGDALSALGAAADVPDGAAGPSTIRAGDDDLVVAPGPSPSQNESEQGHA
nr:ribonuclease III [Rhabdothermincola salaria]